MAAAWYQLPLQSARLTVDSADSGAAGLAAATSPEGCPAPGRELVDLGRPLIHNGIDHFNLSLIERTTMVRPTRSLLVTETGISFAPARNANCSKTVTECIFCRHFLFCFVRGNGQMTNA